MHRRIVITLSVSLFLVATIASVAGAESLPGPRERALRALATMHAEPFVTSGAFTGTMAGEIWIGPTRYLVMPSCSVYEIGNGLIGLGAPVTDRYVTLTGLTMNGMNLVYSVILRPAGESAIADTGDSSAITERQGSPE